MKQITIEDKINIDITRFQQPLAKFAKDMNLIVETGSGASTYCFLKETNAKVISVDPFPFCDFEIIHPNHRLVKKKSFKALADIYLETGAWDLFLHDSDHWIECQMYEYEMAYVCVKEGGYIFSDDYEWNSHFAWRKFCERYNLTPFRVGNIQGVQKHSKVISPQYVQQFSETTWQAAKKEGAKWREENNNPPCWSCTEEYSEYWKFPS